MKNTLSLLFALVFAVIGYAQNGSLSGQVFDDNRVELAKVKVSLVNESGTELGTIVLTSNNGNYEFKNLPPGKYNIQFSGAGYIIQTVKGVIVNADKATWLNATMKRDATYVAPKGKKRK